MMNRFNRLAFALVALVFMFGCQSYTQTPKPAGYEYSTQHKMQSAYHWKVLAQDVTEQIGQRLKKAGLLSHPLYVQPGCGAPTLPCRPHYETPFQQGFRDLLITQMVRRNLNVSTEKEGALVITNDVQVLWHNADRISRVGKPGLITAATALAAGIGWVIRDARQYGDWQEEGLAWGLGALAGATFYDYVSGMFSKDHPHSEVIITTTIKDYDRYLVRNTDVYYINDLDYWHYKAPPRPQTVLITDS